MGARVRLAKQQQRLRGATRDRDAASDEATAQVRLLLLSVRDTQSV
jgi:hypothetical protein